MEIYLLIALVFIYALTALLVKADIMRRIWTLAFIVAFCVTAVAIASLRVSRQDVMMTADSINWYYVLYVFGSMSAVLGAINLWMYRKPLWHILYPPAVAEHKE